MDRNAVVQETAPGLSREEEDRLVSAAQQDPAAFAGLYRRYVTPVYRYLYSRAGSPADAEDLTEQVFLEALESLGRYRPNGPFAAWLFTIARRRAIDALRRRRPEAALGEQVPDPQGLPDPLVQVIQQEEAARLRTLLAGLPEGDQELLRLRFAAGLGFGEVARILRRSEAAAKMKLYRLLRRLEGEME